MPAERSNLCYIPGDIEKKKLEPDIKQSATIGEKPTRKPLKTATRHLSEHSGKIVFGCFTAGNLWLTAKAGIHPDMDTAAGMLFLAQSASLLFTDKEKWKNAAFRIAGATGVLASLCLSYKGIDFDTGTIADGWRTFSPLAGFGVTATLMGFQQEIAQLAEKGKASKNRLIQALAFPAKYPVVVAAAVDSIGITGVGISAAHNADMEMLGITAVWGFGEIGLFMSDPRMQKLFGRFVEGKKDESEKQHKSRVLTIFSRKPRSDRPN